MAEQYVTASLGSSGEVAGEAVLPGRNWHELADAFRAWGLPALADWWSRSATGEPDPWPFPILATEADLDRLHAELAGFDVDRIYEEYDHLPDGDDDVEEAVDFVGTRLPAWITAARAKSSELYVVRSGAK